MRKNKLMVLIVFIIAVSLTAFVSPAVAQDKSPAQAPAPPAEINLKNVESMVILFITKPEVIRELVPKPLVPNEWDMVWISFSRLNVSGQNFNEWLVGTPVGYRGKMYNYRLARIVDNEAVSAQDQAILGVRTPVGRINFGKQDGKVKGTVEMDGRELAVAEIEPGKQGEPLDFLPGVFMLDNPPNVKQLVWGLFENINVNHTADGKTELKLEKPIPGSSLDIPVLAIFRGVYRSADFTLKPQGVLYDYLKKKAPQN